MHLIDEDRLRPTAPDLSTVRVLVPGVTLKKLPTEAITSIGLIGGYSVARLTKKRQLGGLVLAGAGAMASKQWQQEVGVPTAAGLAVLYTGAFGGSHPLAKKIGAWPSVLVVTGLVAGASLAAKKLLATS